MPATERRGGTKNLRSVCKSWISFVANEFEPSAGLRSSVSGVVRKTGDVTSGLVEPVGNAGEDDPWLEEEQPLDVKGALVVEKALRSAEDQLRHDHDCDRVGVAETVAVGERPASLSRSGGRRSSARCGRCWLKWRM
jgi:hypothetical protein